MSAPGTWHWALGTGDRRRRLARLVLAGLMAWFLLLPFRDILSFPDRISVLPNLQTDAAAYHAIAWNLAATQSLDALPPRHPPGWVTLLAILYSVAGPSYVIGKLMSWLALIASTAACAWLARRVHSPPAGWIAALLCASSPALRGYVGTLQYEVITGTGLLAVLVLGACAVDAPARPILYRRAFVAGVAGALLILTRETFAVIVPLIALWMAHRVHRSAGWQSAVKVAVVVTATALAPAVAWSAVQSIRYGGIITISEKGPIVVELGNNPLANGTYNAPLVGIAQPTGLAFVRAHPRRTIELAGRKILYFWGVLRDGWNVPRPAAVWLWRTTTGLVPLEVFGAIARGGWLLALFLVSLWTLGREGLRQWWALPVVVIAIMAVHIAVVSSHRFAVPILPVVFVLVSGPLAALARKLAPLLRAPVVVGAVALLVIIVIAMQYQAWPLRIDRQAVDLDGINADNIIDPVTGMRVRAADAKRGVRPVVLLPDEYLPGGLLRVEVGLRRSSAAAAPETPVARIALVQVDDHVACARDVSASEMLDDRFETVTIRCRLTDDGPATLAVDSLGTADLAVADVRLVWTTETAGAPRPR